MSKSLAEVPQAGELVVGSDFGVPAAAGQQAKKTILIEAIRRAAGWYAVQQGGRNERLVRQIGQSKKWKDNRRGWTLPELAESLAGDKRVRVAAFDFPFSIPLSLLNDAEFAGLVGQENFGSRRAWAKYVTDTLRLSFASEHAKAKLLDLQKFGCWRDTTFWRRRRTDEATGGSPPLKDKYQSVFAMTLAGTAMLERLTQSGMTLFLSSAAMPPTGRVVFETYPAAVADRVGFAGNYKQNPEACLHEALGFLADHGINLDFDEGVKTFCLEYRTPGKSRGEPDPDGADAFLCLVAAICFREGHAELCDDGAATDILKQEGCIIAPRRLMGRELA